jgi:hypothetical protein
MYLACEGGLTREASHKSQSLISESCSLDPGLEIRCADQLRVHVVSSGALNAPQAMCSTCQEHKLCCFVRELLWRSRSLSVAETELESRATTRAVECKRRLKV